MIAFSLSIPALFAVFCVNQASFEQLFNLTREHRITTTPWKYFGYSLLLQKGDPPRLIVGAPKAEYHGKEAGSVFKCDLKSLHCFEFNVRKGDGIAIQGRNGNFLGAILDGNRTVGGSIFTCASRLTQRQSDIHYLNGRCYRLSELGQVHPVDPLKNMPLNKLMPNLWGGIPMAYYEASFGQAGFDMRVTPDGGLLLGVPGMVDWSGAVAKVHLNRPGDSGVGDRVRLYPRYRSTLDNHYSYLGYAVAFGRFAANAETWYAAGEPRGFDLKGRVVIFSSAAGTKDGMAIEEELLGQDYGAYFGSVLLVLTGGDPAAPDDLFVGAPMYGGDTWDEGCVYFYKNSGVNGTLFKPPVKLFGEKRMGARFGTVLADLGDVNLDGIRDVAIAAPYENDGIGAVYVYHSSMDGFFSDSNYERISPMSFTKSPPKGFGLGISNANDVFDGALKGYNAIAIGAYKSGEVFIIPPLPSVAIYSEILPNTTSLYSTTTSVFVRYCVWFKNRNGVSTSSTTDDYFDIVLEMTNDRIVNAKRLSETTVKLDGKICREHVVLLKPHSSDVGHLVFELKAKLSYRDNFTHANTVRVPFSKECDSECHTDLYVIAGSNKENVLVGVDQKVEFNITVGSTSGTAFDVQLLITATPTEIELVNSKNCYSSTLIRGYICPVSDVLVTSKNLTLVFNVANLPSTSPYVTINFTAISHFHDINPNDNEIVVGIPVVVINEPYIEASNDVLVPSLPTEMGDRSALTYFYQTYSIRNYGPSPLDGTISVFVPEIKGILEKNVPFFEVDVFGSAIKEETRLFGDLLDSIEIARHVTFDKAKARVVQCSGNCTQLVFPIVSLKKTSGFIRIKMKFQVSIDLLADKYPSENVVAFVTNIAVNNGTAILEESAATLIFGLAERRPFPWYVAVLAVCLGIFVLAVIIYVLWKFNFFKREFHYKMHNDQGIIETEFGDIDDDDNSDEAGTSNEEITGF